MMKLAMVLATAVQVKSDGVKEHGIGEDLNQCLYGWRRDRLAVVTQMTDAMQRRPHHDRFVATSEAAAILRQGWAIDALTMVAEGFVSDAPSETDGANLATEFAKGNPSVREAITVTHVVGDEVSFVTKSYRYAVPKTVVWDEENFIPGRQRVVGEDGLYPLLFARALELSVSEESARGESELGSRFYDALAFGMVARGFETKSLL
jgi:hypothetical protein